MAAPPPALMDELVEEFLLRLPPEDPASLVRAALVCKRWCRLVSGRGFGRRFRERHRSPPVLVFLGNHMGVDCPSIASFVPTSSFRPPGADLSGWVAIHSCHGRVLFFQSTCWGEDPQKNRLLVWDPMADEQRELPTLSWCPYPFVDSWNAAVLCSSSGAGCNHLDCHGAPFLVVFLGIFCDKTVTTVYSSETNAWGEPTSTQDYYQHFNLATRAVAGNALYCNILIGTKLLKYDLTTREISASILPAQASVQHIELMAMEDGRLGIATMHKSMLHLWSRKVAQDGDARWEQSRVIELDTLLPVEALSNEPYLAGCSDGAGVIFLWTSAGFFSVDLKSRRIKELGGGSGFGNFVVPFMSFCTPALSDLYR